MAESAARDISVTASALADGFSDSENGQATVEALADALANNGSTGIVQAAT